MEPIVWVPYTPLYKPQSVTLTPAKYRGSVSTFVCIQVLKNQDLRLLTTQNSIILIHWSIVLILLNPHYHLTCIIGNKGTLEFGIKRYV